MHSPRNDDSMKSILRSLKNIKEGNTKSNSNKQPNDHHHINNITEPFHLSTDSSSSSLKLTNSSHKQNDSSIFNLNEQKHEQIKSDKLLIHNMIRSHPLLMDLNNPKEKCQSENDSKNTNHEKSKKSSSQKTIVEYDESSDEISFKNNFGSQDEDELKLPQHKQQDKAYEEVNFGKNCANKIDNSKNFNNNNENQLNYHSDLSTKKYCQSRVRRVKAPNQEAECTSEQTKKKLNRANKVFYNGYLSKQDKIHSNIPEYQAHASELLHFLKSLWLTNTMCDLSIVVGNRKYPAHRLGLAMFSRKYKEEFEKKLQNKDSGVYTICLKNSTNFAVESILKYIYTAKIDINPANVEEILAAAKELGIEDLICMTNDYLSSLSIGDVLDYMGNIMHKEGSELMFYELYTYMMTHLDKISRTPEFLKSSVAVVKALLSDSHLSVANEMEVFDVCLRWVEYDKQNRTKQYLNELMKNVRFTLMKPDDIVSKVESQLNLNENLCLFKLVFNAYKYHALSTGQNKLNNFIKREECRNVCLKGASVPDAFVKAIIELSDIAHKLKAARAYTSNKILD